MSFSKYLAFTSPFLPDFNNLDSPISDCSTESLKWYKSLTIHQRINLKDRTSSIIGVDFDTLNFMFSMRKRIDMIWNKLIMEGIIEDNTTI